MSLPQNKKPGSLGALLNDSGRERGLLWSISVGLVFVALVIYGLGWYWSIEPKPFNVEETALQHAKQPEGTSLPNGYVYTATAINIAETILYKRGGYIANDVTVPSVLMDNMPKWEYGALVALRDAITALRNQFSRAQSQSKEDPDLAVGEPQMYYDHLSWGLPSSESEYEKGLHALNRFAERLLKNSGDAQFHARADNLRQYLEVIDKRLGSISLRLSASTDTHEFRQGQEITVLPKTPWLQVDDIFYEARGYTWALLHVMEAVERDFRDTLEGKNAMTTTQQITRELEYAQAPILFPVVLNGSGFGVFSNYSVTLANYIARANAAILDLRDVLLRG